MADDDKPRVITLEWLKDQGACEDQVQLFVERYGDSVELTRANVLNADPGFDMCWLLDRLPIPISPYWVYLRETRLARDARIRALREIQAGRDYCAYVRDPGYGEAVLEIVRVERQAIGEAACTALGL